MLKEQTVFKFFSRSAAIAIGFLVVASGSAQAGTATAPMAVSATVVNACIISATPMAFGNYNPTLATATVATAQVTTDCTVGDVATISMDAGLNAGTAINFAGRAMKLTTALGYQVYTDAARTLIWGDGVNGGSKTVAVTGTALLVNTIAYGSIPPVQAAAAGAYVDTITVTVTF